MFTAIILALGTLFPIVNPLSTTFVFNGLTAKQSLKEKRRIALISSLTAALVLLCFLALGHALLGFFGITIYAFRVAGGLYLGKIAFEMLSKSFYKAPDSIEVRKDIAIIPLAIPLLSGPGAMAAVLVMSEEASAASYGAISIAILLICFISYLLLRYAHVIGGVLGETGARVIERVLGLLVLVIAAQFVFNGVTGWILEVGLLS